jgi:hypothetical protein
LEDAISTVRLVELPLAQAQLTGTGIMFGEAVEEEAERRYGDKTATQRLFEESDLYLV